VREHRIDLRHAGAAMRTGRRRHRSMRAGLRGLGNSLRIAFGRHVFEILRVGARECSRNLRAIGM